MKQFLVILGLTALVWLGLRMAEPVETTAHVRIEITGYDTVRYAMVAADTAVDVTIRCTGYAATRIWMKHNQATIALQAEGDGLHRAVSTTRLHEALRGAGIEAVESGRDSIRVELAERASRTYIPEIGDVEISFAEQCGLYGEPHIEPPTITLYGPQQVLDTIDEVRVMPTALYGLNHSQSFQLPLSPTWATASDVFASASEVTLFIPVEKYIERQYKVPIRVAQQDTTMQVRLYPEEVTLKVWVPEGDAERAALFTVEVNYADIEAGQATLTPYLSRFPSYIRPRSIEPHEVQYAAIKR